MTVSGGPPVRQTSRPSGDDPVVGRFVRGLVALQHAQAEHREPVCVTWLNHYSARAALRTAQDALSRMDVCGVDGLLLRLLLRHPARTSADLVVPALLRADVTIDRVLAIGGQGDRGTALATALEKLAGRPVRTCSVDGYAQLPRGRALQLLIDRTQPDLVLVGLGAGLQESVVVECAAVMSRGYVLTCGGFLDQVLQPAYYPRWAYPLRLNWLVRLCREPRRLWRRYTVHALAAAVDRRRLRRDVQRLPGLARHAQLCVVEFEETSPAEREASVMRRG